MKKGLWLAAFLENATVLIGLLFYPGLSMLMSLPPPFIQTVSIIFLLYALTSLLAIQKPTFISPYANCGE
ncbi:hypothetical protein [Larkinella harenae]